MNSGEKPQSDYQVFLSFRGCDTRRGFTDCLYHFLSDAGVRVFRDNEELRPGDKIKEVLTAINKSLVCIPILSKNYANSKWCLFELAEMVKLKKDIMPIFYKVTADDVKLKTNLYSHHLSKFGKERDAERAEWEKALKDVGDIFDTSQMEGTFKEVGRIKAWTTMDYPGYGELCKEVVKETLSKLEVKHKIFEGPLIGIDDHIEAVRKLMDVDSPDVRFLVIHGVGGVGKTTLAKVIFNQFCDSHGGFHRCCFLDNARETANQLGIVHLQNKLLRELGPRIREIYDIDSGIMTIKDIIKNKKVLIILDDLDQHKQIESLAGDSTWFYSGSRIIITTRDTNCVVKLHKAWYYNMSGMSPNYALKLFSRHAFKMESPPTECLNISKEVVAACGRIPLALEVMGSYLHQIDKEQWKSKIKMIASHKDVQEKLMISYNTLDPRTKEIFLDIACIFVGRQTRYAAYMWEAGDFHRDEGIQCLLSMCLVKISEEGTFLMHDLIRDLGREIVIQENLKRPERRSRLWSQKEVEYVLSRKKIGENLKVLKLIDYGAPLFSKPWRRQECIPKGLTKFPKVLENSSSLIELEISCPQLKEVPNSIGNLKKLRMMKLNYPSITELPSSIGNLRELEELHVTTRTLKYIPEEIGRLHQLRILDLQCPNINQLPSTVHRLPLLQHLYLRGCDRIQELPNLPSSLTILHFSSASLRKLPNLSNLESLNDLFLYGKIAESTLLEQHLTRNNLDWINNCPLLKSFKFGFRGIISLELETSAFPCLNVLELDCADLEVVGQLPLSLTRLHLSANAAGTISPACLGDMEALNDLDLENIRFVSELTLPRNLKTLHLSWCSFPQPSLNLSGLKVLQDLKIIHCRNLVAIQGVENMKFLEKITMYDCPSLREVSNLSKFETLLVQSDNPSLFKGIRGITVTSTFIPRRPKMVPGIFLG